MISRTPLKVLITSDTEAWPDRQAWLEERLEGDIQRDIYGTGYPLDSADPNL